MPSPVTDDDAFAVEVRPPSGGRGRPRRPRAFVPNDCDLSPEQRVLLLTGPNMAGKSTFLRQNALIVVLAQAGLPVPADAAIGVVDRLFCRVGAADDLARGRSTFMVEMTETAAILNQAGTALPGRGRRDRPRHRDAGRPRHRLGGAGGAARRRSAGAIFATHFHELAELADRLPRLRPHTMRVKEWKGPWFSCTKSPTAPLGGSWGVHVAELAGVPAPVVRRAASLLAHWKSRRSAARPARPDRCRCSPATRTQAAGTAHASEPDPLSEALAALDRPLTPRDALDALYRLKAFCRFRRDDRPSIREADADPITLPEPPEAAAAHCATRSPRCRRRRPHRATPRSACSAAISRDPEPRAAGVRAGAI